MGTKKDIAKALKEQLDNLTASPDTKVWAKLESELKAKKKKKIILPIWFDFTTIGILLLLIAFLNKNSISTILNFKSKHVEIIESTSDSEKKQMSHEKFSKSMDSKIDTQENDASSVVNSINNDSLIEYSSYSSAFDKYKSEIEKTNNKNSNITNNKNSKNKIYYLKRDDPNNIERDDKKGAISNSYKTNKSFNSQEDTVSSKLMRDSMKFQIKNDKLDELIGSSDLEREEKIIDSINKAVTDSMTKNTVKINEKEKTSDSLKNNSVGKWSICPNAAFTYYDGLNNSFSDQTSLNYGIYVTYLPHNDLSFRIGFNSLNLTQTSNPFSNRILIQEVRYLEIPLELKYAFIKRKIKTSLVAGPSYLLIQDAKSIVMEQDSTNELANSSDFVESTLSINIGLQFQTKIYKKFYFNLEPMFKYHFKPYAINQDFNPFIISITGGVEYKF